MAVCPQHDVLWPDLTCEEHLWIMAKIRGEDGSTTEGGTLAALVEERLRDVYLYHVKDQASGTLSGGMQRRLSVAIACVAPISTETTRSPSACTSSSPARMRPCPSWPVSFFPKSYLR